MTVNSCTLYNITFVVVFQILSGHVTTLHECIAMPHPLDQVGEIELKHKAKSGPAERKPSGSCMANAGPPIYAYTEYR